MYFRNYGLRKTLLDQPLKSPVSEDPLKSNIENAPKYVEVSMKAPFPYLLFALKANNLQNASVSDMPNLKTVS